MHWAFIERSMIHRQCPPTLAPFHRSHKPPSPPHTRAHTYAPKKDRFLRSMACVLRFESVPHECSEKQRSLRFFLPSILLPSFLPLFPLHLQPAYLDVVLEDRHLSSIYPTALLLICSAVSSTWSTKSRHAPFDSNKLLRGAHINRCSTDSQKLCYITAMSVFVTNYAIR